MDRKDLYAALDRYLEALAARDPARLDWAQGARLSENNVMLAPGDGLWATIDALGEYQLRFADPVTRQVGSCPETSIRSGMASNTLTMSRLSAITHLLPGTGLNVEERRSSSGRPEGRRRVICESGPSAPAGQTG